MFGLPPFFHNTIRKYNIAFGSLFNDVQIQRFDKQGNTKKTIKVPIAMEAKERYITHNEQSPEDDAIKMVLPRMSFLMGSPVYDAERATSSITKMRYTNAESGEAMTQYSPSPWNFPFELNIIARHMSDGHQIIEQILPFFDPHIILPIKNLHGMGNGGPTMDIPLILDNASSVNEHTGTMSGGTMRILTWTLSFTMRGWVFKPTDSASLIKKAIVSLFDYEDREKIAVMERVTVYVDPEEADAGDDYEVREVVENFSEIE